MSRDHRNESLPRYPPGNDRLIPATGQRHEDFQFATPPTWPFRVAKSSPDNDKGKTTQYGNDVEHLNSPVGQTHVGKTCELGRLAEMKANFISQFVSYPSSGHDLTTTGPLRTSSNSIFPINQRGDDDDDAFTRSDINNFVRMPPRTISNTLDNQNQLPVSLGRNPYNREKSILMSRVESNKSNQNEVEAKKYLERCAELMSSFGPRGVYEKDILLSTSLERQPGSITLQQQLVVSRNEDNVNYSVSNMRRPSTSEDEQNETTSPGIVSQFDKSRPVENDIPTCRSSKITEMVSPWLSSDKNKGDDHRAEFNRSIEAGGCISDAQLVDQKTGGSNSGRASVIDGHSHSRLSPEFNLLKDGKDPYGSIPVTSINDNACITEAIRQVMSGNGPSLVDGRRLSTMSSVSEATSSSDTMDMISPDTKVTLPELCPVCGDKVSGYHYGLLTCESCKGFFKRTVQNKKVYSCVDNQTCLIDKAQRKRCPSCRFQKCIQVGMKVEAVRTDRMRGGRNKFGPLYKRDRAIKMQAAHKQNMLAQHQRPVSDSFRDGQFSFGADSNDGYSFLPPVKGEFGLGPKSVNTELLGYVPEMRIVPSFARELQDNEIDSNEFRQKMLSFAKLQLENHSLDTDNDILLFGCEVIDYLLLILVEWSRSAIYFKDCSVEDQMKILQVTWSELIVVEFVYSLMESDSWSLSFLKVCSSQLPDDDLAGRLNLSELRDRLLHLKTKLLELQFDNIDYSCMKYLILFNPDIVNLDDSKLIEKTQEKVNAALFDYSISFFSHIPDKFGQLLLRLPEVRLISIRMEEILFEKSTEYGLSRQSLLMELLMSKKNSTI